MSFDFSGKVVLVTGATGNLGSEVVRQFHESGAKIALVDLRQEKLDAFCEKLGGEAEGYKGFAADLSQENTVKEAVDAILAHYGHIDVLVHTVGGFAAGEPVHKAGVEVLDRMFQLNVRPLYMLGGAVAAHMVEAGIAGKIVFVLAKSGLKGSKHQAAYTASKAAAFRVMESMALELREHNIAVNGISPSIMDTPSNRQGMPDADYDKWVTPSQVANGILFLASENAGIFGTNLEVYGKSG